jgi:hypothetical protein
MPTYLITFRRADRALETINADEMRLEDSSFVFRSVQPVILTPRWIVPLASGCRKSPTCGRSSGATRWHCSSSSRSPASSSARPHRLEDLASTAGMSLSCGARRYDEDVEHVPDLSGQKSRRTITGDQPSPGGRDRQHRSWLQPCFTPCPRLRRRG